MSARETCHRCGGSGVEPRDPREEGAEMRAAREARRIGLREMARRLNVTAAYVSDLERGRRAWTGPAALRIRDYLTNT